jgi:tetratricopeptide (TPR) repeat protein
VFVGGWSLEAAEVVCVETLRLNILDGLASLLDKNLVKQDIRSDGKPRFMMLETIREYALERLDASGELDNLRNRHADYFTSFAQHTTIEMRQIDFAQSLNILETEHDNFRAALAWNKSGLRLAFALRVFWSRRGHMSEGTRWLEGVLAQQAEVPLEVADRALRARTLEWLGTFHKWQGELDTPQLLYEQSLSLFLELGDTEGVAEVLGGLGQLLLERGDYEQSGVLLEKCLAIRRESGVVRQE